VIAASMKAPEIRIVPTSVRFIALLLGRSRSLTCVGSEYTG
jgi:hypothetical protein